jgi:hypothetical protein
MTRGSGFAARVLGATLLLELLVIGLAFTADHDAVYFLGRRINVVCTFRQRTGIPCPTCGFTRGSVLTLHGQVREAWRLSPSGPLAVFGLFGMGVALLAFAGFERRSVKRWIQTGALAYASIATVIWVSTWISVVTMFK